MRETEAPGFEFRRRDRDCALLRIPVLGRNGRPVIIGFQSWSIHDLNQNETPNVR